MEPADLRAKRRGGGLTPRTRFLGRFESFANLMTNVKAESRIPFPETAFPVPPADGRTCLACARCLHQERAGSEAGPCHRRMNGRPRPHPGAGETVALHCPRGSILT